MGGIGVACGEKDPLNPPRSSPTQDPPRPSLKGGRAKKEGVRGLPERHMGVASLKIIKEDPLNPP